MNKNANFGQKILIFHGEITKLRGLDKWIPKNIQIAYIKRQSFQISGPIVERPPRNLGTKILSQNQTPLLSFDVMEFFNQNQLYHTTIPNMRFRL